MNSQQGKGKDTALAYLKIAIHLLNERMDELDFKLGRNIVVDDLNRLTSDQMLKIVMFLLRHVVGEKPLYKLNALNDFNKFGVGLASYDCGIDQIYHAVKQIFPEDCDLFNYSVLLLPSSNPKRTKAVISYIMSFVLMCDSLEGQFNSCFDDVIKENEDKVAICGEVDDLKDKIAAKIQEKETEKQRLPGLQNELQHVEESIQKEQNISEKLSAELERLKSVYESKENKIKHLQQELEQMNMELITLEQQIVSNPDELQAKYASVKNQLEVEMKRREEIGSDLVKCGKECEVYESLIQRAHHAINSFESVILLMENAKSKIELYTKIGNEMTTTYTKIEIRKEEWRKLTELHGEKLADVNRRKNEQENKLKELRVEVLQATEQMLVIKGEINTVYHKMKEISDSVGNSSQEVEKLKVDIAKCVQTVKEEIPKHRREQEAEAVEFGKRIVAEFSYYPILKLKSSTNADKSIRN